MALKGGTDAPAVLRSIRLAGACFVLTAFVACAKMGPPPGGPPDTTPPGVLAVMPESLAVGVPVTTPIRIQFSEKLDEKSLESAIWVRCPAADSCPQATRPAANAAAAAAVMLTARTAFSDSG